jgi:hypothetical protein
MTNRKISEFVASTGLPADTYLTLVTGGKNTKIALADFLAALNVTGSIVQDGATTGTPVLDVAGTVNNIRNIEDGPGVLSSVSAENGLTIEHNFGQDTVGVPVLVNPTNAQPFIASLEAGSGIAISGVGNHIEISVSGTPTSVKTVVVNELSDLPAASGGVITLADDTDYLLTNDINIGTDRLAGGNRTIVRGADSSVINLSYTGTGTMFTSVDKTFRFDRIKKTCANGQLLDVSATAPGCVFQMTDMTVDVCDTIGTISGVTLAQFNNVAWNDIATDGLTISGSNTALYMQDNPVFLNGGTFLDLDSATIDKLTVTNPFATLASGTTFLSGLVDSGNINTGGSGTIINGSFQGLGTPLNNINPDDARWFFLGNDAIQDTRPDGLLSLNGAKTVTISAINTPVKIGGVAADWIIERVSQATGNTDGSVTYDGERIATLPMLANITAEVVSGTNKDLTFYIAIDGAVVANSAIKTTVSSGAPKNTTIPWQEALSNAQYVEVWVENNSDATDVLVNTGILRLN